MKADEKVCPYCAETIKAAAVKCRYCGSDLSAAPSTDDEARPSPAGRRDEVPLEKAAAEPAQTPETAQASEDPASLLSRLRAEPRPQHTPVMASVWTTALLVLISAALVLSGFLVIRHVRSGDIAPDGQNTSAATRAVLLDQASKMTASVLSYTSTDFDKDNAAAQKLMTISMGRQYAQTLAKVRSDVLSRGLTLTATIQAASLVSLTQDEAKVLEFVNQTTTAKGVKTQQFNANRVVVTLDRVGGTWLISRLDAF